MNPYNYKFHIGYYVDIESCNEDHQEYLRNKYASQLGEELTEFIKSRGRR